MLSYCIKVVPFGVCNLLLRNQCKQIQKYLSINQRVSVNKCNVVVLVYSNIQGVK